MKKTIYLAGAMDLVSHGVKTGWRKDATAKLRAIDPPFTVLDPTRDMQAAETETLIEEQERRAYSKEVQFYYHRNLMDIQNSDFILVGASREENTSVASRGTLFEIGYAVAIGKKVICFKGVDYVLESPLVRHAVFAVVKDIEAAIQCVEGLSDGGKERLF